MAKVMTLPKIGVNMTEATIMEWLVKEGDSIKEGDHIVTAETDKASQEIYASHSGVVIRLLAEEGQIMQCQEPLVLIADQGEKLTDEEIEKLIGKPSGKDSGNFTEVQEGATLPREGSGNNRQVSDSESQAPGGRVKISPLAKKTAKNMGIDFRQVLPARKGLRIIKKDILAFVHGARTAEGATVTAESPEGPVVDRVISVTSIRKTIADRMTLSVNTIPRAVLNVRVNAENLLSWKEGCALRGNKVGITDLIIKASAKAIEKHPLINSRLIDGEIRIFRDINIGVAVDTEKGLMVPVIHHADKKGVVQISKELREKSARVRAGTVRTEDLRFGTLTITNLGMLGIEQFIPIINPPECAILAVGSIVREPVVCDETDEIKIISLFWISLAFDHRIIDGVPAGKFLMELRNILELSLSIVE